MQDILSAIGNVGFPMAVTAFLLVRIEAKLGQLNDSIAHDRAEMKNLIKQRPGCRR